MQLPAQSISAHISQVYKVTTAWACECTMPQKARVVALARPICSFYTPLNQSNQKLEQLAVYGQVN